MLVSYLLPLCSHPLIYHFHFVTDNDSLRTDCTIAGISLYTQNLLVVLAYTESEEGSSTNTRSDTPSKKGRQHRHNALEPELRLIDVNTKEEISADTLTVSRYETLSASDYHLGVLPPMKIPAALGQRGALGTMVSGLETIGQGVWDVSMYPGRLFTSGGSILSGRSGEEKGSTAKTSDVASAGIISPRNQAKELTDLATSLAMKIFIYSPYDCIVALKRDLGDRLQWLNKMEHYQQAWELLDQHPEAVDANTEASDVSSPTTPSKSGSIVAGQSKTMNSLADFFADSVSLSSQSRNNKNTYSVAEKEKRKIGERWLQQLINARNWVTAGEVAGKVVNTTSRWEHWAWIFIRNNKFEEITPHLPTFEIAPPLPSLIYEIILGHYVSSDRARFKELLDLWPSTLFDADSIITAIEDQLRDAIATLKDSSDWRLLQECLAKLFVANGRSADALRCYIHLQDADTALTLIKEHHLLSAVADDIPGLILLRVSRPLLQSASVSELEDLTSEPIALLVDEAYHGTVQPEQVVDQLQKASLPLFLFFYLRALWLGQGATTATDHQSTPKVGHSAAATTLAADQGKVLVEQFADTAVPLFADYDRDILMDFLHTSTAYTFETAVRVCEKKHYVNELVYLLAKTGQMKKALFLIIDELKDVVRAISFAKQQNDPDLWDDLLDYSMSRPKFIQGLLAEVGTAVDPIKLVKRIPSGLEVEGLRDGLKKMVREYDLQDSISQGVAKVLQGEVAVGMEKLRKGRRKGIKFDVEVGGRKTRSRDKQTSSKDAMIIEPKAEFEGDVKPGHCAGCGKLFREYGKSSIDVLSSDSYHGDALLTAITRFIGYAQVENNTESLSHRILYPRRLRLRPRLSRSAPPEPPTLAQLSSRRQSTHSSSRRRRRYAAQLHWIHKERLCESNKCPLTKDESRRGGRLRYVQEDEGAWESGKR
jgi:vacuolar protein sorting-associated protein 41